MANANLFSAFAQAAAAAPGKPCFTGKGTAVSFGEMLATSAQISRALRRLGIRPGDRVVAQVDKSPQAALLYLGVLRAGAVFVPLNTAYTPAEVDYFVRTVAPSLLVAPAARTASYGKEVTSAVPRFLTLEADGAGSLRAAWQAEEGVAQEDGGEIALRAEDDTAAILFTSGTTGRAKGAMLSHGNLASNVRALDKAWHWQADDVLLHALPIYHAHGLFVALHCALLRGSTMIFCDRFDADAVIDALPGATVFMGVPTYYTRLLANPRFGADSCRHMRLFVCGSAPLTQRAFNEFEARTGLRILERYGMTETLMITSNEYQPEGRLAGSVGFALPGLGVRVVDESGGPAPAGEPGILEVKGPNVFKGYWRMPDKTAEAFCRDGYFVTGDRATMARNGRVAIVGRATELIISGGLNIYPKEIEILIDALPGVAESAVIGVPHPDFGESVVAAVVADPGEKVNEDAVLSGLEGCLARFKQPKRVFALDELPRNAMGKVQKNLLREQFGQTFQAS